MADLKTILGAAPIGLLMLIGSYVAARRRKSGHRQAMDEYPGIARSLGLEHRADGARIGTLRGRYRDRDVFVDPDERPRLVVRYETSPPVAFRNYEREKREPQGMVRVRFGRPALDGFFRDAFVAADLAAGFREAGAELEAKVRALRDAMDDRVVEFSLTDERLECVADFGRPAHFPAQTVLRALPAACDLAGFVEDLGRAAKAPPDP